MNYEMLREIIGVRRKSFGFLAFLVLLNLSLFLYLSLWQKPELARAQSAWFAKRDAAARGADQSVAARYRDGLRDLELFQKRLIPKKDFAGFLNELFSAARNNSLSLKGITYKPTLDKATGLVSYGIGFTVSGKYAAVKSFIADLARFPEMATLDSISLGNSSQTEESVDLKVQLTAYLKMEGA
jgi:type IV pilus assembly protein PilO